MRVSGIQVDPADRLAGLDVQADGIEPDMRAVGVALHPDLDRRFAGEGQAGPCETGEETPADLQDTVSATASLRGHPRLVGLRHMPQHHMRMGLLDAGMPGVEIDIDVVDLAAGSGEIVEALVLVGEILDPAACRPC